MHQAVRKKIMENTKKNSGRLGLLGRISAAAGIFIAAVLVMAGAGAVETYAEDWYTSGGIQYKTDGDTLTIKAADTPNDGYTAGVMPNFTLLAGETLTGDASGALMAPWTVFDYSNVKNVVIEDGVANIGDYAFGSVNDDIHKFDSVTIGKGVSSIGKYAFANTEITSLTDYAIGLSSSKIDATAFITGNTSDGYSVGVVNAECYADNGIYALLSGYNTAATKVKIDNTEYTVNKAEIKIDLITVNVTDYNLFETAGKMYVTWSGAASEVEAAHNTTASVSSDAVKTFLAQSSDASKWKIFAISKSDTAAPVDEAILNVPTPSAWKTDYKNIKVYVYNEATSATDTAAATAASVSEITTSVTTASDYITFPISKMGTYALYYDGSTTSTDAYSITMSSAWFDTCVWTTDGTTYVYGGSTYGTTGTSAAKTLFAAASNANKYKIDDTNLKAFDLSATKGSTKVTDKIDGLVVRIPLTLWNDSSASVKVLTISSANNIEEVASSVVEVNGTKYIQFTPPHFSPYALYLADTTTVTTTATTAATTTAATTKAATTSATNVNGGSGYNGSGRLDSTPGTGVKDYIWIIIPVAVMLLGVGIVILGRRKQKNID